LFGKVDEVLKAIRNAKVEEEYIEVDGREYTLSTVVYRGREYVDMNDLLADIDENLSKAMYEDTVVERSVKMKGIYTISDCGFCAKDIDMIINAVERVLVKIGREDAEFDLRRVVK